MRELPGVYNFGGETWSATISVGESAATSINSILTADLLVGMNNTRKMVWAAWSPTGSATNVLFSIALIAYPFTTGAFSRSATATIASSAIGTTNVLTMTAFSAATAVHAGHALVRMTASNSAAGSATITISGGLLQPNALA